MCIYIYTQLLVIHLLQIAHFLGPWDSSDWHQKIPSIPLLQNSSIALAWASSAPSTTSKCRCCTYATYTVCDCIMFTVYVYTYIYIYYLSIYRVYTYKIIHIILNKINKMQTFNFRFAMARGSKVPVSLNMYLCSRNLTVEQ